ncbi:MAG TPA: tubulin/FtsZ family protein [Methanocorpusculum sp.]|nr:tubulin/FtsZ family protein [Methanocorpusculum sp.]
MRIFFIGFGQAGGKLVDMFIAQNKKYGSSNFRGIIINSAKTDLLGVKNIPLEDRLLIGQTIVKGHGVGTDNFKGAQIAADEIDTIINAIDHKGVHDIDAFVVCAGLGGGTGSGGAPVLCRHLKRIYREPVYALGILPSREEGRLYSLNAARSLTTLVNEADNVFVFDNSTWKNDGDSVKSAYEHLNEEIVRRFGVLFRAGEANKNGVGEMVVDASEIINTLRDKGISSVGYAVSEAITPSVTYEGGPNKIEKCMKKIANIFSTKPAEQPRVDITSSDDKSAKIIGLVRRAMLGRLTLPCNYATAERALVLVAGPASELDRKGVEKSKIWVEENIAGIEVRGGDYPVSSDYVAAVVLLATITDAPRIRELMQLADDAKKQIDSSPQRITTDMFDPVDPLFK